MSRRTVGRRGRTGTGRTLGRSRRGAFPRFSVNPEPIPGGFLGRSLGKTAEGFSDLKEDFDRSFAQTVPPSVLPTDEVDHPAHYGGEDNPHEHVKCMEGIGLHLNAFLYNCTKYIWRQGKKPSEPSLRDLQKARWYLNREISRLEKK